MPSEMPSAVGDRPVALAGGDEAGDVAFARGQRSAAAARRPPAMPRSGRRCRSSGVGQRDRTVVRRPSPIEERRRRAASPRRRCQRGSDERKIGRCGERPRRLARIAGARDRSSPRRRQARPAPRPRCGNGWATSAVGVFIKPLPSSVRFVRPKDRSRMHPAVSFSAKIVSGAFSQPPPSALNTAT